MAAAPDADAPGIARPRWHPLEIAFWLAPIAAFFAFPDRRLLLSQIFVYGLFALSLDLVLGYAGILSLGHAAFFGTGAYTAALLAQHGWTEPLSGLLASGAVSAAFGLLVSLLVVPGSDLGRLMVTLGVGLLMFEVANQASSITGGVDGLTDLPIGALFGKIPLRPRRARRLRVQLRDPALRVPARATTGAVTVRPRVARHPRERAAHAGHRRRT